jgi:hypothetical protein
MGRVLTVEMTALINEIIGRGNTAEVKMTKDGVMILEVHRKVRCK